MSTTEPPKDQLDHTPGKVVYDNDANWHRITQDCAAMLQAIHDERNPQRMREMMARFVSSDSQGNFNIRLPFRCHYVRET
jgi:hypothetical protein